MSHTVSHTVEKKGKSMEMEAGAVGSGPTKEVSGLRKWDHGFKFEGESFTLFKRVDSRDAGYNIDFTRGKRVKRALKSNNAESAAKTAIECYIKPAKRGRWEVVAGNRSKTQYPSLAKIEGVYLQMAPLGIKAKSAKNNTGMLHSVLRTALGRESIDPQSVCVTELTGKLVREFKANFMAGRLARAEADGEDVVELARRKGWTTGNSMLGQARSVFCKAMRSAYRDAGLALPDSILEFLSEPGFKKLPVVYSPAPDSVVKATFAAVGQFLEPAAPRARTSERDRRVPKLEPMAQNRNCYLAFWLAVGCGLRKSEINRARWEFFKEQDGGIWFVANVPGKDHLEIKVPVVTDAWEHIAAVRQESGPVLAGGKTELSEDCFKRIGEWMNGLGWKSEKKIHELRAYIGSKIAEKHGIFQAHLFLRHKDVRTTKQFYARYLEMRPLSVSLPGAQKDHLPVAGTPAEGP